jgi:hypothetical protein
MKGGEKMKKAIVNAGIIAVLLVTSAIAAEKTTCRITGRTMGECCCEMKSGKFYCKFTKKAYDECCCDMK